MIASSREIVKLQGGVIAREIVKSQAGWFHFTEDRETTG